MPRLTQFDQPIEQPFTRFNQANILGVNPRDLRFENITGQNFFYGVRQLIDFEI